MMVFIPVATKTTCAYTADIWLQFAESCHLYPMPRLHLVPLPLICCLIYILQGQRNVSAMGRIRNQVHQKSSLKPIECPAPWQID